MVTTVSDQVPSQSGDRITANAVPMHDVINEDVDRRVAIFGLVFLPYWIIPRTAVSTRTAKRGVSLSMRVVMKVRWCATSARTPSGRGSALVFTPCSRAVAEAPFGRRSTYSTHWHAS
jgi:hypothetical protein